MQKYENNNIALAFIKAEGLKLVNIGSEDITGGKLKLILGLIWTLILRYQIQKGGDNDGKNALLEWVRQKIPEYDIKNFTKDWNDGRALCALNNALQPGLCPGHRGLNPANNLQNAHQGIDLAFNNLGIPKILEANELVNPKVDEHAVMTYISFFRDFEQTQDRNLASLCSAYGPGLVEGIVNETSEFYVINPSGKGKLEVKVFGPKSEAKVQIKDLGGGKNQISYTPTEPGEYEVHVTLDGKHIPGSIFHVTVLEALSLGGEGKIRVFYSTTSAKEEKTRPMQEFLEKKSIHLRPDFEPWIAVDIMDKKDRDAVFKKAGTNQLPIVYIDDEYIGDYAKLLQLDSTGQLDKLLGMEKYKRSLGKK
jgi:filamin